MDGVVERLPDEDGWQRIWGVKTTETTAEDGTVTKTISGGSYIIGPNFRGKEEFSVSVTFDPSNYEMGQLSGGVDLMAAAYEAQKMALRDSFSGYELQEQSAKLDASYQEAKDETANSFAQLVGVSLEARGQVGQVKKVYDSVQAVFASFEAKYHAVALSSPNGWAKAGLFEAVVNLQRLGAPIQPEVNKQNGLYTLQELELTAAGVRGGLNINA
ncbi:MAG: hypothetical protein K2M15_05785 [Oscillospiraceae bacterium]|nr:hypothetical protein [Oscillospiraceae bacterium]